MRQYKAKDAVQASRQNKPGLGKGISGKTGPPPRQPEFELGNIVIASIRVEMLDLDEEYRDSLGVDFVSIEGVIQSRVASNGNYRVQFKRCDNYDFVKKGDFINLDVHSSSLVLRKPSDPIYGNRMFIASAALRRRAHAHNEFSPCPGNHLSSQCIISYDYQLFWPSWEPPKCITWEPWAGTTNDSNCPSNLVFEYEWRTRCRSELRTRLIVGNGSDEPLRIHGIRAHAHCGELDFTATNVPCFDNRCCSALFDFLLGPGDVLPHLSTFDPKQFLCVRDRDLPLTLREAALKDKYWNLTITNEEGEIEDKDKDKNTAILTLPDTRWYKFRIPDNCKKIGIDYLPIKHCTFMFSPKYEWVGIKDDFRRDWLPHLGRSNDSSAPGSSHDAPSTAASSAPVLSVTHTAASDLSQPTGDKSRMAVGPDGCADREHCLLLNKPSAGRPLGHSCGRCGRPLHGICGRATDEENELINRICRYCSAIVPQDKRGMVTFPGGTVDPFEAEQGVPLCSRCHQFPMNPNDRNADVTLCIGCISACAHEVPEATDGVCGVTATILCNGTCGLLFCRQHIKDMVLDHFSTRVCFKCADGALLADDDESSGGDGSEEEVESDAAQQAGQQGSGQVLSQAPIPAAETKSPEAAAQQVSAPVAEANSTEALEEQVTVPASEAKSPDVVGEQVSGQAAAGAAQEGLTRRKPKAPRLSENKWEVKEEEEEPEVPAIPASAGAIFEAGGGRPEAEGFTAPDSRRGMLLSQITQFTYFAVRVATKQRSKPSSGQSDDIEADAAPGASRGNALIILFKPSTG